MKQVLIMGLLLLVSIAGTAQKAPKAEVDRLKVLHYKAPCWGESIRLYYLVKKKAGKRKTFIMLLKGLNTSGATTMSLL